MGFGKEALTPQARSKAGKIAFERAKACLRAARMPPFGHYATSCPVHDLVPGVQSARVDAIRSGGPHIPFFVYPGAFPSRGLTIGFLAQLRSVCLLIKRIGIIALIRLFRIDDPLGESDNLTSRSIRGFE